MKVSEHLGRLLEIHQQRNKLYKDDYDRVGDSLLAMFPDGVTLTTREDFNRFIILVHIHSKLFRYCQQFSEGGHPDSLDDTAVYSMILRHLDDSNSV